MKEIVGNLWYYFGKSGYQIVITTNGFVRKDGCAVMGRGCAFEAARKFPDLPKLLGKSLRKNGNIVKLFRPDSKRDASRPERMLLVFPVKHNWYDDADVELIKKSALVLKAAALFSPEIKYVLPRPGCGNGNLAWEDVKPLLQDLPDNVLVIHRER